MRRLIQSLFVALHGIKLQFLKGGNFTLQIIVALLVALLAAILHVSKMEWLILLLFIGLVLSFETLNSAIEELCDFNTHEKNEKIKRIKDLSAGAVLILSIFSLIAGLLIFLPRIISCLV